MHLSLLLFAAFPLAVSSCIMHSAKNTTVPKEWLEGFKHVDALDFVTWMKFAGVTNHNAPATDKYVYLSVPLHGQKTSKCNEYCGFAAAKYDREFVNARVKKTNGAKAPVADQATCRKECASDCGKNDCKKECDYLCEKHFSFKNRKEYEAEFNELVGRFNPPK